MDNCFDSIVEQLRRHEQKLSAELSELETARKALVTDQKRVQAALTALGERREKPTRGKATAKPAPTRREVIAVMARILQQHAPLEKELLKSRVEQQIELEGKSKMGLALRFEEALQDNKQFVQTPGGWNLAASAEGDTGDSGTP